MSQILEYLKSEQTAMATLLAQWVNHASPTSPKPATDRMGQLIAEAFVEAGATLAAIHPQTKYGNHYTLTFGEGTEQILLLNHFDTVWPLGEAAKRPFTIDDQGIATGPGIHDMKSGIVIALFALKAIHHLHLTPRYKLVYLLTADEEAGSPSSRPLIETEGKKSRYCLVFEGARQGKLVTARKGVGRFKIEVYGVAAHAGVEPEKGVNAIEELAHQIQVLHAMTDFERGITVSVGVIAGGERPNIIAPYAYGEIDLRVSTRLAGEEVMTKILNLRPQLPGSRLTVAGQMNRWPFEETSANLALFEQAQLAAHRVGLELDKTGSGGGSDANFTAALGVPTLDGLGSLGGGPHALSEHTMISALPLRAALVAELLLSL
jgi:glutamate carboxypeptidase